MIGLSISIEQQLTNLSDLINQLKLLSLNTNITILLGGPIFALKELRASEFGACDICINAKHAVGTAESLLTKDWTIKQTHSVVGSNDCNLSSFNIQDWISKIF